MSRRIRRWLPALCGCAAFAMLIADPQPIGACGPFFERAVFTHVPHPDLPLESFATGTLGILQPTYARSYLVVAYRLLNNRPLPAQDVSATVEIWRSRLRIVEPGAPGNPDPTAIWLQARNRILPGAPLKELEINRRLPQYDYYENCQQDALRTASTTLDRVARTFGPSSPMTKEWVRAQDAVFAACSGSWVATPPLAADAPAPAIADRAYQIAAAHFYTGDFDGAAALFRQIAADPSSPWRMIAPYLVARTLIRKGTLVAGPGQVDRGALTQAQTQLQAVIDDPSKGRYRRAAQDLMGFVRFRLAPNDRLNELAHDLVDPRAGESWEAMLTDYTLLLDKLADARVERFDKIPAPAAAAPLGDWVMTMQATDQAAFEHAWSRWQSTNAEAWLVAAVSKAPAADVRSGALRDAAAKISRDSPAFLTVSYHAARLAVEARDTERARTDLDRLIALPGTAVPGSARNQLLALRMDVASGFDEWLRFAMRRPVTSTADIDGTELPDQDALYARLPKAAASRMFDRDATAIFNAALPLSRWIEAAAGTTLSERLRRDVAVAGWTRAVLLGDFATADRLAPLASRLAPALATDLAVFQKSSAPTRQLAVVTTLLRFPGTRPVVEPGLEREAAIGRLDSYSDNWWCNLATMAEAVSPVFVTGAERAAAQAERQRLIELGAMPRYLGQQAIALARQFPDDPRAPEILYLTVRATRYGCRTGDMGDVSKAAFDLLHKRYPATDWARKTPYWYR